ncbi:thioredoxin reductase gliT [Aspergillus aculeatinus CBS 121060]|uniref:FAD/NAD(P)-binding domain-containing protein n=1 Tax=Aspergillus aculeatinus CBS 121060 TaxID=1448322 RepID=A0ACD1H8N8_9EURO|nr:FAD/NAD(P)-binding domain-containing protein [Aspergillus aculeatinus CBS 121060]RAH69947.1 FAD/NAD(P)-binding domain-containing protein [Aspergillus aculeatinus CBS 121060]
MLYDVLIIGAGPAGLSAALCLARTLHTAVVFDSQSQRNRPAAHLHAVLTWDHQPPAQFLTDAKANLLTRYRTIQFHDANIQSIEQTPQGLFHARDHTGAVWRGRSVLLAMGVRDIPPAIEGYTECWASGIFHCLFCHGYEERGAESCGVLCAGELLAAGPVVHMARLAARLAKRVTLYTNGEGGELEEHIRGLLRPDELARFVVDSRRIVRMVKGEVASTVILQFATGEPVVEGFVVNRPRTELQGAHLVAQLGCRRTPHGLIEAAEPLYQSSVAGVFAAGDCVALGKTVTNAMATGAFAGAGLAAQLGAKGDARSE